MRTLIVAALLALGVAAPATAATVQPIISDGGGTLLLPPCGQGYGTAYTRAWGVAYVPGTSTARLGWWYCIPNTWIPIY